MSEQTNATTDYVINLDEKFGQSARFDVDAEAAACAIPWFNQTLTSVNDALVRMGIFEGEFHWHKHDEQDEFFFVLDGEMTLEVEGRDPVRHARHCGYTVPKGVMHRPVSPQRSVVLMVEKAGIVPTGD